MIQTDSQQLPRTGFTLVELMIVLAMFLIVFTLSNVSLSGLIANHSTQEFSEVFMSDARRQQMRAIAGELSLDGNEAYGIRYGTTDYVLFSGAYAAENSNNVTVSLPRDIEFIDVTFPNRELLFEKLSGEVSNFDANANSITIRNTTTNETSVLTINQLGVFSLE